MGLVLMMLGMEMLRQRLRLGIAQDACTVMDELHVLLNGWLFTKGD